MRKVLYFSATWCAACFIIGPLLERIAEEHPEIEFHKIDVDDDFEVANYYNVQGMPTLIYMQEGKEVARVVGPLTRKDILEGLGICSPQR